MEVYAEGVLRFIKIVMIAPNACFGNAIQQMFAVSIEQINNIPMRLLLSCLSDNASLIPISDSSSDNPSANILLNII